MKSTLGQKTKVTFLKILDWSIPLTNYTARPVFQNIMNRSEER